MKWLNLYPHTLVTHLPNAGSDHCPLLLDNMPSHFKFVQCFIYSKEWATYYSFHEMLHAQWSHPVVGPSMNCFLRKTHLFRQAAYQGKKSILGTCPIKSKNFNKIFYIFKNTLKNILTSHLYPENERFKRNYLIADLKNPNIGKININLSGFLRETTTLNFFTHVSLIEDV